MMQVMLDKFLEQYKALDKKCDRFWDLMERYKKEGNKEKSVRCEKKMDEVSAEMDGMRNALCCFGYTVVNQQGNLVIVSIN